MIKLIFGLLLTVTSLAQAQQTSSSQRLSDERIIFRTNAGDIVIALYPDIAPKHAEQILRMVKAGIYNGTPIGRVEPGFVAQVYDYNAKKTPLTEKQQSLIKNIPAEFSAIPHTRGIVSMARRDGDVNSAESSFSFILGPAPHLDQQYTVVGEVVSGMDVLSLIENIKTDRQSVPMAELWVDSAQIVDAAKLEETKLQAAHSPPIPYEQGKLAFEIMAGFLFFFTISTPIAKSLWNKPKSK